jgi:O-antigen/teichoic acid export membrane protein
MREVFPIGAGIVLSALYFRVDVLLIELWRGTPAVGLYNAVFRLVEALRLFPAAVLAVSLPTLCRASSRRPLRRVALLLTLCGTAASAALWIAADRLIPGLYGARYVEMVPVFKVLVLAFPLMSLNYALTHQLVGWHRHGLYAVVCAAALLFNVAMNITSIPTLGVIAAAWTTVWTEAVVTCGCVVSLAYVATPPSTRPSLGRPVALEPSDALVAVENRMAT